MTEEIHEMVKTIKQSFRLMMNGVASSSMREKGVVYKLNWGVPLTNLQEMATSYGKNYELAIELWKEDIRECKIMATYIMPPEKMLPDMIDVWMEKVTTQEIAEILVLNLLQHVDSAPVLAYQWIASDDILRQITGYHLLSRLFMKKQEANERGINEFIDHAATALQSDHVGLKHAAANCVYRFIDLGDAYEKIAQSTLGALI